MLDAKLQDAKLLNFNLNAKDHSHGVGVGLNGSILNGGFPPQINLLFNVNGRLTAIN